MKIQIQERPVRIGGHLLRPGENVRILGRAHPGRFGKFRGELADGRLVVKVRSGTYSQTLLRLDRSEIEIERGQDATPGTEPTN
jgi:hypothetical protein